MKTGRIARALGAIASIALLGSPGFAAPIPFPTLAHGYGAWLVRAFDECNPAIVSVSASGVPSAGCLAANASTDSILTMGFARLRVSARSGKVGVFGHGLSAGGRVQIQLTLRVTKHNVTTKHPPASSSVTFADQTVLCPNPNVNPFGYVVRGNGALVGSSNLADCLAPNTGLASGNIEIIDAALVNRDTGKIFAHPGVLR